MRDWQLLTVPHDARQYPTEKDGLRCGAMMSHGSDAGKEYRMPYPSLLWKKYFGEKTENVEEKLIPAETFRDLYLTDELRRGTVEILSHPCGREEIPMRQKLFTRFLGEPVLLDRMCQLREDIEAFERLIGRMDRAESEYEKVLLFLASAGSYFEIAEKWQNLPETDCRIGEIRDSFGSLLTEESIAKAKDKCFSVLSRRPSSVSLTIRGGQSYASEGRTMKRQRIEDAFVRMGFEEAIPQRKHPSWATPEITKAFTEVYAGYYESAKSFYNAFSGVLLEGENNIRLICGYIDEISFYADTVKFFEKCAEAGCPLCYPEIADTPMAEIDSVVDPSLVRRGLECGGIVPNDVRMYREKGGEKLNFFILSGANGGGKTTYLRACGLAVLFFITGCPVTAVRGKMYPFDSVYTHFPADESFDTGGRFVNEAARADEIMEKSTAESFVLFNETYSGTDEKKSEDYASRLAERMYSGGVFGIFVTHIHALTGGKIPTLAAVIDENDENRRTYKIRRVGGTDSSFAADILEKYRLDKASLRERLESFGKENDHV